MSVSALLDDPSVDPDPVNASDSNASHSSVIDAMSRLSLHHTNKVSIDPQHTEDVRVVMYNLKGTGAAVDNKTAVQILRRTYSPDVILLQECTWSEKTLVKRHLPSEGSTFFSFRGNKEAGVMWNTARFTGVRVTSNTRILRVSSTGVLSDYRATIHSRSAAVVLTRQPASAHVEKGDLQGRKGAPYKLLVVSFHGFWTSSTAAEKVIEVSALFEWIENLVEEITNNDPAQERCAFPILIGGDFNADISGPDFEWRKYFAATILKSDRREKVIDFIGTHSIKDPQFTWPSASLNTCSVPNWKELCEDSGLNIRTISNHDGVAARLTIIQKFCNYCECKVVGSNQRCGNCQRVWLCKQTSCEAPLCQYGGFMGKCEKVMCRQCQKESPKNVRCKNHKDETD